MPTANINSFCHAQILVQSGWKGYHNSKAIFTTIYVVRRVQCKQLSGIYIFCIFYHGHLSALGKIINNNIVVNNVSVSYYYTCIALLKTSGTTYSYHAGTPPRIFVPLHLQRRDRTAVAVICAGLLLHPHLLHQSSTSWPRPPRRATAGKRKKTRHKRNMQKRLSQPFELITNQ